MQRFSFHPRHVLPLMILTAILMVGARMGGVWDALVEGKLYASIKAVHAAEETKKEAPQPPPATAQPSPQQPAPAPAPDEKKAEAAKTPETPAPQPPKSKASPESDLFRQLQGRREQLDKRAQEIDSREALALITEKRVDQKIKEMEGLRAQLQKMIGQVSEEQQTQIENLVKIYEIMKPKEAAKIFETLELPILLGVVQRMKPARTAAVMAEMNPEKAKEITTALTKKDQIPQVK